MEYSIPLCSFHFRCSLACLTKASVCYLLSLLSCVTFLPFLLILTFSCPLFLWSLPSPPLPFVHIHLMIRKLIRGKKKERKVFEEQFHARNSTNECTFQKDKME